MNLISFRVSLLICIIGSLSGTLMADEQRGPKIFEDCFEKSLKQVQEDAIWQRFLKKDKPNLPGEVVSSPAVQTELENWIASLCMDFYPLAHSKYEVAPLNEMLDSALDRWHEAVTHKSSDELVFIPIESILRRKGPAQNIFLQQSYEAFRRYLRRKSKNIELEPRLKTEILSAINGTREPSEVLALGFSTGRANAYVCGESSLYLSIFISLEDEIPTVFHESCHEHPETRALYRLKASQLSSEDWIYLTLAEEFRAVYLTAAFKKAWQTAFNGFSFTEDFWNEKSVSNYVEAFKRFRNRLLLFDVEQSKAVNAYLQDFDRKTDAQQNKILKSWIYSHVN